MKSFLLLTITAVFLSPIAAKADDYKVRDTCGQMKGEFISPMEAHKRLGLPKISKSRFDEKPTNFSDRDFINQIMMIDDYCEGYTGVIEVYNN